MSDTEYDEIDLFLCRQFEGPIADAGFSARVMQKLPLRRRARWPLWSGALIGAIACYLSLIGTPLLRTGLRDWLGGEPSLAAIATWATTLSIAWLVLGWGLAESRSP